MLHDRNNNLLHEGDIVKMSFIVKQLHANVVDGSCNATLESVQVMPSTGLPMLLSLNTRQVVLSE